MGLKIVADDFGMSDAINTGIINLANQSIVSKISIMPDLSLTYPETLEMKVLTGLHANFTYKTNDISGFDIPDISPLKLFYMVQSGKISEEAICKIVNAQYDFVKSKGFRIDYLDSHHHVHIAPGILRALLSIAKSNNIKSIRCITMKKKYLVRYLFYLIIFGFVSQMPKMLFLYSRGHRMKKILDSENICYSDNLILMPLAVSGDYIGFMRKMKTMFGNDEAEIVIHPGLQRQSNGDDYSEGRYIEYCSVLEAALV